MVIKTAFNESDEANYVVGQIMMSYRRGGSWKDNAVLYRMNAQSNALEYAFKRNGVPYKIYRRHEVLRPRRGQGHAGLSVRHQQHRR